MLFTAKPHLRSKIMPVAITLAIFLVIAIFSTALGHSLVDRITTVMFINVIMVLGLQMFMGNSGLLSFAHVGFMGIGAYASALFSLSPEQKLMSLPSLYEPLQSIHMGFLPALFAGALISAVFAAVVGFPLMRLADTAAAIASFALLVIVHVVLSQWTAVTNGPRTLFGLLKYTDMWTAAGWAFLAIIAAFVLKESKLGMWLRASRDNVHAADAIGVNVIRARWIAFTISAFVSGLAGGLWAHFITSFQPNAFYMSMTFIVLTMLIVGGPQTVSGTALGVLIITVTTESLRQLENNLEMSSWFPFDTVGMTEILLAVALILMLTFKPGGIVEINELGSGRKKLSKASNGNGAPVGKG